LSSATGSILVNSAGESWTTGATLDLDDGQGGGAASTLTLEVTNRLTALADSAVVPRSSNLLGVDVERGGVLPTVDDATRWSLFGTGNAAETSDTLDSRACAKYSYSGASRQMYLRWERDTGDHAYDGEVGWEGELLRGVNASGTNGGNTDTMILAWYDGTKEWLLGADASRGVGVRGTGSNVGDGAAWTQDTWAHVRIVRDGANVNAYFNGELVCQATYTGLTNNAGEMRVQIGDYWSSTGPTSCTWAIAWLTVFEGEQATTAIASDMVDAINGDGLGITASLDGSTANLTNDVDGTAGNVSIVDTNVGAAATVSGMSGGAAAMAANILVVEGGKQKATTATLDTTSGDLVVTGNLTVTGTKFINQSTDVLIDDNHLYLNASYTTAVAQTGGLVVNYLPTATVDATTGAGVFVAGVAATSNPTVTTLAAAAFAATDLIQISGSANNGENDGLYEVLTHAANLLTIRGIGTTATLQDFSQNQFVANAGDTTATLTKVTIAALRAGTDGTWETASGSTNGLSFSDIGSGAGNSLDAAYGVGRTITVDAGPVVLDHSTTSGILDIQPGLAAETAAAIDVTFTAVAYTGTPHGILVDYGTATSVTNGSDVAAIDLNGATNAGAGDLVGISIDANFDQGIENAGTLVQSGNVDISGSATTDWSSTGAVTATGNPTWDFGTSQADFGGNLDANNGLDVTTAALTSAAGTTHSGGLLLVSGGNAQINDDIVLTLGTGDDFAIDFDAASSGNLIMLGAAGAADLPGPGLEITTGAGGAASAGPGGSGGALTILGGAGGADAAAQNAGDGAAVTIQAGAGGPDTNAFDAGAGGDLTLKGGDGAATATLQSDAGNLVLEGGTAYGTSGAGGDVNISAGLNADFSYADINIGYVSFANTAVNVDVRASDKMTIIGNNAGGGNANSLSLGDGTTNWFNADTSAGTTLTFNDGIGSMTMASGTFSTASMSALTLTPTNEVTITAGAASTWHASSGDLTIGGASQANSLILQSAEATADAIKVNASNAAGGIDMDAGTGGMALDSTGAISLDAAGASNFATSSGALTLTGAAASTWSTSAGALTVNGTNGLNLQEAGATVLAIDDSANVAITGTGEVTVGATGAVDGCIALNFDTPAVHVAIAVGDLLAIDRNGKVLLADANHSDSTRVVGIAMDASNADTAETIRVAVSGKVALADDNAETWVASEEVYIKANSVVRANTAQAGAAGTVTLDASASAADDAYNGHWVEITGGTGSGQLRHISDYVGSSKVATVDSNWGTNPDATSTFNVILPDGGMTTTAPSASGTVVRRVGYATADGALFLQIGEPVEIA
jgi:hypothetical protein